MAGPLPVFVGPGSQRGYGLGGILSGLFRTAIPFVKRGAASLAKEVGKEALTTGAGILEDVMVSENIKHAAARRAKAAGKRVTRKTMINAKAAIKKQLGSGKRRNRKRKVYAGTPVRKGRNSPGTFPSLSDSRLNRYIRQSPMLFARPYGIHK